MKAAEDILCFLLLLLVGAVVLVLWLPTGFWSLWKDFRLMQAQDRQIRESLK